MQLTFSLMTEAEARKVLIWRYDEPYAIYNASNEDLLEGVPEMLDRRSPYYIVRDEQGEIVGFFNFGTSALVWDCDEPGIFVENRTVAIGLGMQPDKTGKGLGLAFVEAGLDFARRTFAPEHFCLYVYTWNERAIRVYERAGFRRERVVARYTTQGERQFLEMIRDA